MTTKTTPTTDKAPTIYTERRWTADDVRAVCIRHEYYTAGDTDAYADMLEDVDACEPTPENLFFIAADIYSHSDPENAGSITSIMFNLEREAVEVFYTILCNPYSVDYADSARVSRTFHNLTDARHYARRTGGKVIDMETGEPLYDYTK